MSHENDNASRSSEGDEARSRHDERDATEDADSAAQGEHIGTNDGEERRSEGQKSSLTAIANEVEEVDEILEGELSGSAPRKHKGSILKTWQGPLPAPDDLAAYDRIYPGAAKEIVDLARREVGIREVREQTIKTAVVGEVETQKIIAEADRDALKRGQWLAWTLAVVIIVATTLAVFLVSPWSMLGYLAAAAFPVVESLVRTVSDGRQELPASSDDNGLRDETQQQDPDRD